MTKSEAAFMFSAERLFDENRVIYFWTFTFVEVHPDWWYSQAWARFVVELSDLYGGQLRGLKVVELHKEHGIHFHCLLNKRVCVHQVRRIGKRYGVGIVHVRRADRGAVAYLAKYLSKQFATQFRLFGGVSRWGSVGGFRGCRVRDVESDSEFHRRVRRAQELLGVKKLTFLFACALFREREMSPEQLETACRRYALSEAQSTRSRAGKVGSISMVFGAHGHRHSMEAEFRNLQAVRR